MKLKSLTSILTISAFTLISTVTTNQLVRAQGQTSRSTFFCGSWEGVPTTMARTPTGEVPVIRWASNYFSGGGYDNQTRCNIVSDKFQEFNQQGILQYMTTGRSNGYNIVCVAQSQGGSCAGQLFTLKQGSDPNQTLQRLMQVRNRASGPLTENRGRVYINMDQYLEEATASASPNTTNSTNNTLDPNSTNNTLDPNPTQNHNQNNSNQSEPSSGGLW